MRSVLFLCFVLFLPTKYCAWLIWNLRWLSDEWVGGKPLGFLGLSELYAPSVKIQNLGQYSPISTPSQSRTFATRRVVSMTDQDHGLAILTSSLSILPFQPHSHTRLLPFVIRTEPFQCHACTSCSSWLVFPHVSHGRPRHSLNWISFPWAALPSKPAFLTAGSIRSSQRVPSTVSITNKHLLGDWQILICVSQIVNMLIGVIFSKL